jgi:fructoselysine-6-P-deglycase FrlB-like protein
MIPTTPSSSAPPALITWNDIALQPTVWQTLLQRYNAGEFSMLKSSALPTALWAVGEGSSHHAATLASQTILDFLPEHTLSILKPWLLENKLNSHNAKQLAAGFYLYLSQSGKTSALLQAHHALAHHVQNNPNTLGFTNATEITVPLASICTKGLFHLQAGEETAIAATKTFSATVLALCLWSLTNSTLNEVTKQAFLQELHTAFATIHSWLTSLSSQEFLILQPLVTMLTEKHHPHAGMVLIGRGSTIDVLPEVALKLTETTKQLVTWENSEGFKHGGMAVLNGTLAPAPCLLYCVPPNEAEAQIFYQDAEQHLKTFHGKSLETYPKRLWIRASNSPSIPPHLSIGTPNNYAMLELPTVVGRLPQQLLLLVSLQALCYATSNALQLTSDGLEKFIGFPNNAPFATS